MVVKDSVDLDHLRLVLLVLVLLVLGLLVLGLLVLGLLVLGLLVLVLLVLGLLGLNSVLLNLITPELGSPGIRFDFHEGLGSEMSLAIAEEGFGGSLRSEYEGNCHDVEVDSCRCDTSYNNIFFFFFFQFRTKRNNEQKYQKNPCSNIMAKKEREQLHAFQKNEKKH